MQKLSRRTALASIASISATGGAVAASALHPSTTLENPVAALVAAHRRAEEIADQKGKAVSDLQAASNLPIVKVEIGHSLRNGVYEKRYASTAADILRSCQRHRQHLITYHSKDPYFGKMIDTLEVRQERLLDEFLKLRAERTAAEEACGYTAALKAAEHAGAHANDCLRAILKHPYRSAEEIATAASYLVECNEAAIETVDTAVLLDFVKMLALLPVDV